MQHEFIKPIIDANKSETLVYLTVQYRKYFKTMHVISGNQPVDCLNQLPKFLLSSLFFDCLLAGHTNDSWSLSGANFWSINFHLS